MFDEADEAGEADETEDVIVMIDTKSRNNIKSLFIDLLNNNFINFINSKLKSKFQENFGQLIAVKIRFEVLINCDLYGHLGNIQSHPKRTI